MQFKKITVCLILFFLVFSTVVVKAQMEGHTVIQTDMPCSFYLPVDETLKVQAGEDNETFVSLVVEYGSLNGTDGEIYVSSLYNGRIAFTATTNCVISVDAPIFVVLGVNGASNFTRSVGTTEYTNVIVLIGNNIVIAWNRNFNEWLDKYIVLFFLIAAIIIMIASVLWAIHTLRHHGLNADSLRTCGYCGVAFIIGFGLFLVWLYW